MLSHEFDPFPILPRQFSIGMREIGHGFHPRNVTISREERILHLPRHAVGAVAWRVDRAGREAVTEGDFLAISHDLDQIGIVKRERSLVIP